MVYSTCCRNIKQQAYLIILYKTYYKHVQVSLSHNNCNIFFFNSRSIDDNFGRCSLFASVLTIINRLFNTKNNDGIIEFKRRIDKKLLDGSGTMIIL